MEKEEEYFIPRRAQSPVWEFFRLRRTHPSIAVCIKCKEYGRNVELKYEKAGTSALLYHCKSIHSDVFQRDQRKNNSNTSQSIGTDKVEKKDLPLLLEINALKDGINYHDRNLMQEKHQGTLELGGSQIFREQFSMFLLTSLIPMTKASDTNFRRFFHSFVPFYKVPTVEEVHETLLYLSDSSFKIVRQKLDEVKNVSVSIQLLGMGYQKFLFIAANVLGYESRRVQVPLDLVPFGTLTRSKISQIILEALQNWNIMEKVEYIFSNFDFDDESREELSTHGIGVARCIISMLEQTNRVLYEVQKGIADNLRIILEDILSDEALAASLGDKVNFEYIFVSLKGNYNKIMETLSYIEKNEAIFNSIVIAKPNSQVTNVIDPELWRDLKFFKKLSSSILEAVELLEGENRDNITISFVLNVIQSLKQKLMNALCDTEAQKLALGKTIDGIQEIVDFLISLPITPISLILDPRFKNTYSFGFQIKETYEKLSLEIASVVDISVNPTGESTRMSKRRVYLDELRRSIDLSPEAELRMYSELEEIDIDSSVFAWWSDNGGRYRRLADLASKYLCHSGLAIPRVSEETMLDLYRFCNQIGGDLFAKMFLLYHNELM